MYNILRVIFYSPPFLLGAGDPSLVYDKFTNVEKLLEKVIGYSVFKCLFWFLYMINYYIGILEMWLRNLCVILYREFSSWYRMFV